MKRTVEADSTELEQQRGLRDHVVRIMNGLLSDPAVRGEMLIIPVANFSRLVLSNTERMFWDKPLSVFTAFPESNVLMNTAAVNEWLALKKHDTLYRRPEHGLPENEPQLTYRDLYKGLFVDPVTYIPWATLLDVFDKVARETVDRITKLRREQPRRITLLALNNYESQPKSNIWFTGLVWNMLAPVVDYVVANDTDADTISKHTLNLIATFFGVLRRTHQLGPVEQSAEMHDFLDGLDIDVIYVDDMIYSGTQVYDNIFDGIADKNKTLAARVHVHLVIPYIAEMGAHLLERSAHMIGSLEFPTNHVSVKPYRDNIAPLVNRFRTNYSVRPSIAHTLKELTQDAKPAIVFEHKLADETSLPLFIDDSTDAFHIGMPSLVDDPAYPFYKLPEFLWRMKKSADSPLVTDFTNVQTLFLALHREWQANPPCVSCGRLTTLKCRSCGIVPYCSHACAVVGATHPFDRHTAWCASVRVLSAATAQLRI